MTRPRYETEADRQRESSVGERFAAALNGVTVEKLPHGHRADFLARDTKGNEAYVEVKTRRCTSRQYDTYHISYDKLKALVSLAEKDGRDALLLVQWKDTMGYVNIKKYLAHATFKKGGRWDRGDKFDVEEMAEAPISLFTFL